MGFFNWGKKKKPVVRDIAKENEELRKQLDSFSKSSKNQSKLESKQIKLINRQLRDSRKSEYSQNKEVAIKRFRHGIEMIAPKKRTQAQANAYFFGGAPLKQMTKKPSGSYFHF